MKVTRNGLLVTLGVAAFTALHFASVSFRNTTATSPEAAEEPQEQITAVKYVVRGGDFTKQFYCGQDKNGQVTFAAMIMAPENSDVTPENFMSKVGPGDGYYAVGGYNLKDDVFMTVREEGTNKTVSMFELSADGEFNRATTSPSCTYLAKNAVGTEYYFAVDALLKGFKKLAEEARFAYPWSSTDKRPEVKTAGASGEKLTKG